MAVVRGLETHTALLRDIVPIPLDRRVVVGGQHREVLAQGNTGVLEEALRKGPRAVGIRHDLQVDLVVRADIRCINRKPLAHHLVVVRREGAIVAALESTICFVRPSTKKKDKMPVPSGRGCSSSALSAPRRDGRDAATMTTE